jgi:glycerol-3-phosphate dehydrogenase subunit B
MAGRERRTGASPLARQLYAVSGVNVDRWMRPLGPDGTVAFDNLYAAGGLLAGADRAYEGSRQGIGLATAFRAVESALGHRRSA